MPDPLAIAAAAIALASTALQLLGKKGNNGALSELELKVTNDRRRELDALEDIVRGRMHDLSGRVGDLSLRHDIKLNELDLEIKILKRLFAKWEDEDGRKT